MLLLEKVFKVINESNLDYCIQNKYEMMPEEIRSIFFKKQKPG